jgi:hypothetical protein
MHVDESSCKYAADLSFAQVPLVSDFGRDQFPRAIEELAGLDAKNLAIAHATAKLGRCALDPSLSAPFPVNSHGTPLHEVHADVPEGHPDRQPYRYAIVYTVTRCL